MTSVTDILFVCITCAFYVTDIGFKSNCILNLASGNMYFPLSFHLNACLILLQLMQLNKLVALMQDSQNIKKQVKKFAYVAGIIHTGQVCLNLLW